MSKTTREVIAQYESWSSDLTGLSVADAEWFPAAIYEQFIAARATDILEELLKDASTPNKFVQQTIGCVALERVRVEECPCAPPSGCTWLRTTLPIPVVIGDIISVSGIGGNLEMLQSYTYRDWQTVKFSLESRLPAERTRGYFCIRNNYLYVIQKTSPTLKALAIAALFYDPVEVQRFPQCSLTFDRCKPFLDYPLYIDPAKYQKLLASTFQLATGMKRGALLDTTNNAQPPIQPEPPKAY